MRAVLRIARSLGALSLTVLAGCPAPSKPSTGAGAPPDPRQALAHVGAASQAFATVQSLTDQVGARPAGSDAYARAVAWGLLRMHDFGLAAVHAEDVKVTPWERLAEHGAVVAPVPQPLMLTALGGSVATPEGGLEGEVVAVDTLDALAALPDERVRGKIALVDVETRKTKDGSGYGKAVGARGKGASIAAKKGAIGYLVRSIATSTTRLPHTGALHYDDGTPKIPAAALAVPDAQMLHRLVDAGGPVRVRLVLETRDGAARNDANVIGDVLGREHPEQIVLIGAHLDSWDLGRGAIDDGAGVAIVLEAARRIQALPTRPRRTLRVVLFANEERGIDGALAYAAAHAAELPRHVLALESDLGGGRVWTVEYLGGPKMGAAVDDLVAPLGALGVRGSKQGESFGADISPLRFAGVPQVELHQDATLYFDHHHSADDTLDKIDPKALEQAATALAVFAYGAADALDPAADFGRVPDDKRGKKWW
ncbi:MAG: M28 family metallopeptidase [Polyangiales bacterium]